MSALFKYRNEQNMEDYCIVTHALKTEANQNGYQGDNASAKVCQDIVLKALATGPLSRNVTIKGGVVMRSKTNNVRRATQDLA